MINAIFILAGVAVVVVLFGLIYWLDLSSRPRPRYRPDIKVDFDPSKSDVWKNVYDR